jgi:Flp pilus assembly protein CpaB
MRDSRAWIFLAVGLVLAGLTGFALYGVAQQAAGGAATGGNGGTNTTLTAEVIVAKSDLGVRTLITPELVTRKTFPLDLVPAGALKNDVEVVGLTTIAPIPRGQPIVRAQLSAATVEGQRAVSQTIEKGKVLVAFPTADPLTTAGLVNIGDRVDILATVVQGTGENAKVSQTTLQNLEVIDIIGSTKEQPQRATSLVFAVDHQVALVLKYLRDAQATVDLAIRSQAETDLTRTTAVDLGFVVSTYGLRR